MFDLKELHKHREALLLAEVAAWLHDMGKCTDAFLLPDGIGFNASNCQGNPRVNPHKAILSPQELQRLPYWQRLSPRRGQCARLVEANHNTALWRTLNRLNLRFPMPLIDLGNIGNVSLEELILWGRPLVADRYVNFRSVLGPALTHLAAILGYAHKSAHMEKEDKADGGNSSTITSPFGLARLKIDRLDQKLKEVLESMRSPRSQLAYKLKTNFTKAPGDTRRPINEVTLWDWSSIVAALYKAEVARYVLTGQRREPRDIAWRLLSLRTDGLSYLLSAPSIPDLLARRNMLQDGWNRVRRLLEETYPLGLEVYRDENGSVFVVPDIEQLDTALVNSATHKTLGQHILEKFAEGTIENDPCLAIKGEIVPEVYVDSEPWKGQPTSQELPPIGKNWKRSGEKGHLERETHLIADPRFVADAWRRHHGEICTVCGLRPQGPSTKAKNRNVCGICERRRADRAKEWATEKLYTTIWVDEVVDVNGRLALLVGTFDLTHWLSGVFVRTLAVRDPKCDSTKTADVLAKSPSFARLRRIWETTRRFWQEVVPTPEIGEDSKHYADRLRKSVLGRCAPQIGPRLEIRGQLPRHVENPLGPYHAYEIVLPQDVKVSALWDPENKRFIILENLLYIARLLDENVYTCKGALETVKSALRGTLTVGEPTGYGAVNKVWGEITVEEGGASEIDGGYFPVIPILAEPRIFMALVPADKALKVVEEIKAKYEREMGKVRNRLPLHLGIVFAHRRTPMRALLDAGRQMLRRTCDAAGWQVRKVREQPDKGGTLPERFHADQNGQFAKWYEVVLEKNGCQITWYVPMMMGDGQTKDPWYPYVFLETDDEPTDRSRRFLAPNPETGRDGWLVHVGELKSGDRIYFAPSTFDYEFLDVTSRRFEIHYDGNGRRVTRPTRPYYLDDLERLNTLWYHLLHLSRTQRHQVISTVETTREVWFGRDEGKRSWRDDVFKRFVADTLAGAAWPGGHPWRSISPDERTALIEAGMRGELADLAELHMEILKEG
jgi:hypothetical protein